MILHQTWIGDAVVGSGGADAPARFLHYDGQDEAVIDAGLEGNLLDCVVDGADLKAIIVNLLILTAGVKY